jgi:hypothetical protein
MMGKCCLALSLKGSHANQTLPAHRPAVPDNKVQWVCDCVFIRGLHNYGNVRVYRTRDINALTEREEQTTSS